MTENDDNKNRRAGDNQEEKLHRNTQESEFLRTFVTPPDLGPLGLEAVADGAARFWNFVTGRR